MSGQVSLEVDAGFEAPVGLGPAARNGATAPPAGGFGWSNDVRVMVRPFATYRQLGAEVATESGAWLAVRRPLFYLGLLGGIVSMTAAGRLVPLHVVGTMLFWSFLPLLQVLAVAVAMRAMARRRRVAQGIDLLFVGQAPWLLCLLAMVGICLFAPSVYMTFGELLSASILPIFLVLTYGWSSLLTLACYRAGLGLGWRRSGLAFLLHHAIYGGTIVAWFWFTNQLEPLLVAPR